VQILCNLVVSICWGGAALVGLGTPVKLGVVERPGHAPCISLREKRGTQDEEYTTLSLARLVLFQLDLFRFLFS